MEYVVAVIASIFAGAAGSMGLGGGSVLLIYLTVFAGVGQLTAQGINLVFFLPIGAIAVFIYWRKGMIDFKKIWPFIAAGIPLCLIFGYLVKFINADILRKIFGGLVLIFGLYHIFAKGKENKKEK